MGGLEPVEAHYQEQLKTSFLKGEAAEAVPPTEDEADAAANFLLSEAGCNAGSDLLDSSDLKKIDRPSGLVHMIRVAFFVKFAPACCSLAIIPPHKK